MKNKEQDPGYLPNHAGAKTNDPVVVDFVEWLNKLIAPKEVKNGDR